VRAQNYVPLDIWYWDRPGNLPHPSRGQHFDEAQCKHFDKAQCKCHERANRMRDKWQQLVKWSSGQVVFPTIRPTDDLTILTN